MIYNPFQKSQLDICVKSIWVVTRSKWQDSTGVTGVAGGKKSLTCLTLSEYRALTLHSTSQSHTHNVSVFCQYLPNIDYWGLMTAPIKGKHLQNIDSRQTLKFSKCKTYPSKICRSEPWLWEPRCLQLLLAPPSQPCNKTSPQSPESRLAHNCLQIWTLCMSVRRVLLKSANKSRTETCYYLHSCYNL